MVSSPQAVSVTTKGGNQREEAVKRRWCDAIGQWRSCAWAVGFPEDHGPGLDASIRHPAAGPRSVVTDPRTRRWLGRSLERHGRPGEVDRRARTDQRGPGRRPARHRRREHRPGWSVCPLVQGVFAHCPPARRPHPPPSEGSTASGRCSSVETGSPRARRPRRFRGVGRTATAVGEPVSHGGEFGAWAGAGAAASRGTGAPSAARTRRGRPRTRRACRRPSGWVPAQGQEGRGPA